MYVTDGNILTDCTLSGANTTKKKKEQKHKQASICRISAKSGEQIKTEKPKKKDWLCQCSLDMNLNVKPAVVHQNISTVFLFGSAL